MKGTPTMMRVSSGVLLLAFVVSLTQCTPPWPSPYWEIPGDYCRSRYPAGQCCEGREDPCSVPILGTLCYCDRFCNRTQNSDCCPDYFTHCEGLPNYQYAESAPEAFVRPEDLECPGGSPRDNKDPKCYVNGRFISPRETYKDNCNTCKCQVSPSNSQCMELLCESKECLLNERSILELESGFRSGQYSWRPSQNYSDFWGKSLDEGISKKLGTFRPQQPVSDMSAIKFRYRQRDLPSYFDARDKWPGKIGDIRDQGWCGASWAFSTAAVASDRFAIEGQTEAELSVQSLLSCNTQGQSGCRGGYVDRAWNYLRRFGSVPESCYPFSHYFGYEEGEAQPRDDESCLIPRHHRMKVPKRFAQCPEMRGRRTLFRTQPAYKVGRRNNPQHPKRREHDIMFEIMTHGPVQALMEVSSDFFLYKSGVYQKTNVVSQTQTGFHSVKILGWGEDRGLPYWLCANSWGSEWGEDGTFKIRKGVNECNIEDFVVGVWAQTDKRMSKLMRARRRRRLRTQRAKNHRYRSKEKEAKHYNVG